LVVAEWLPGAAVVKAFNTLDGATLLAESRPSIAKDHRFALFVAGNNARANARVSSLIEEIGFAQSRRSLERGGRLQEPGTRIFGTPMLPSEARRELAVMH
jgi:predicted dinucleotide-binding enzyme